MAKPRIFVSSTYYDLKHIRASLELFVNSMGFEAILSEKGDIAFTSDRPLDESCYREVENADVFVLIVGGRYGSEASSSTSVRSSDFFDRYESITKKEYQSATEKEVPVYVLVEKGVYAEYQTFTRNRDHRDITYAHVDSVNVFLLIDDILSKQRNNPLHTFERFSDIEFWLREQWAGLFRELLRRQAQQQQLAGLSQQVVQLRETNETLKKYLESVMLGAGKSESTKLIESEEKRLEDLRRRALRGNQWVKYVMRRATAKLPTVETALREASGFEDFARRFPMNEQHESVQIGPTLKGSEAARRDLNDARAILGLAPFEVPAGWANSDPEDDPSLSSLPAAPAADVKAPAL